jgi:hypothetical protein
MSRQGDGTSDDLFGLDPHDPEVKAFTAHRNRMAHPNAAVSVEDMLRGVDDFARGANQTGGHRRVVVVTVVLLILVGVVFALWETLSFALTTFLG